MEPNQEVVEEKALTLLNESIKVVRKDLMQILGGHIRLDKFLRKYDHLAPWEDNEYVGLLKRKTPLAGEVQKQKATMR